MKNLLFILTILLFVSCGTSKKEGNENVISIQDLKAEVMAVHDEVMPKMGDIRRLRKDLMLQADSLMEMDSVLATNLNAMADELDAANEGMMQWMRDYEPEFEGTEEEIRAYLEEQKNAVQKVKEAMLGALEKGEGIKNQQ